MSGRNVIEEKSIEFAIRIINLYKFLTTAKSEFVMSKQILRAGTSMDANIAEAQEAQSKADFISKLSISLKECRETRYWLTLLERSDFISKTDSGSLDRDASELNALLISIIKTAKLNLNK